MQGHRQGFVRVVVGTGDVSIWEYSHFLHSSFFLHVPFLIMRAFLAL